MKKFLFATALTVASVAQAGSLNLDLRADHDSVTYNDEAGQDSTNKYYFKTIRLNYEGKVNEELSFRLRAAYNKAGTATAGAGDNSQTALEFAYLTHKMSDLFSLTVGKIGSDHGAIESTTSGADLYLTSQAYTKTGPTGGLLGQYLSTSNLLYVLGAKGTFTVTPDHNISIIAFKVPGSTADSEASVTGLSWKGAFLDKALKTHVSYHMGNGATNSADKHELMSAGFVWSFSDFAAGVDFVNSSFKEDASSEKDSVTSYIAKIAYTGLEHWTPRLEIISSEEKVETNATAANNGTNKYMGYGAVLEYKPFTETNFRYHVAYNYTNQEVAAGTADANAQQIIVGARLYADFLK
ncbi:MAG: porin [Bdellovibrio sp.]